MEDDTRIAVRTAKEADLDDIMFVEQSFSDDPSDRASSVKMISRIRKFGEGFFLTEVGGKIASLVITCCVKYDPSDLSNFSTWEHITNNGFLDDEQPAPGTNALYIVSGVVEKNFRDPYSYSMLYFKPYPEMLKLALKLNLDYIIAGAVMPSYARYCEKYGHIPPAEYAFKKKNGKLVDPLLERYRQMGAVVPDERHVIQNYYEHPGSLSCSAIVVHNIAKDAPAELLNDN